MLSLFIVFDGARRLGDRAMLTRRNFQIAIYSMAAAMLSQTASSQDDEKVTIRVRADETVRNVLRPIEQHDLSIQPDQSDEAKTLAERTPPGRAVPIILIIVGAIAVVRLLEMIKELYRKTYYGGVVIDTRSQPPSITNDVKIPADMVFVINKDGTTSQFMGAKFDLVALKTALSLK
jgi:hypothetical protein